VKQALVTARRRAVRLLYLPTVLSWMVAVELAVRPIPLSRLSRLLGVPLDATPADVSSPPVQPPLSRWQAGQLRTLLPLAKRWPFAVGPCLRQALVAGHILRKHHPVLRLGVATNQGAVQAHAWVEVGGVVVGDAHGYLPLVNDGP